MTGDPNSAPLPTTQRATETAAPVQAAFGGFWTRIVASTIDIVILNVLFGLVSVLTGISQFVTDFAYIDPLVRLASLVHLASHILFGGPLPPGTQFLAIVMVLIVLGIGPFAVLVLGIAYINPMACVLFLAMDWLYFAVLESSVRGATVGKTIMGLRVLTGRGERMTFLRATGRFFSKFVSGMAFCIGFIMIAFTDRKRGMHDMIANTVVIKTR